MAETGVEFQGGTFQDLAKGLGEGLGKGLDKEKYYGSIVSAHVLYILWHPCILIRIYQKNYNTIFVQN